MTDNDRQRRRMVVLAGAGGRPFAAAADPELERAPEQEPRPGLIRDYLGIERRTLWIFLGLVVGAFVVTTLLYGSIFGFRTWADNMQRAGSLMVINYCPRCGGAVTAAGHVDAAGSGGGQP